MYKLTGCSGAISQLVPHAIACNEVQRCSSTLLGFTAQDAGRCSPALWLQSQCHVLLADSSHPNLGLVLLCLVCIRQELLGLHNTAKQ